MTRHVQTHTYTHKHECTNTRKYANTHICAHTHTHIHTGMEPPPAQVTHAWKAGFEARMALSSVITNMAKVRQGPKG